MRIKILDAATLGDDIELDMLDEFGEVQIYSHTAPEEVAERIRDAEVLVLNKVKLGEWNLAGATALRLICITATGYDNVDVAYCRSRGIGVTNVVGYSSDSVAQLTVSMVLSLACHLREYDAFVRDGRYSRGNSHNRLKPTFHELRGMTWGVVGLGNIGMRVASVAEALGCRVIANKRSASGEERYPIYDLDTLLSLSDIVSLHVPLTPSTRGMLSRERLRCMKQNAILVNVARGAVMDEEAVAEAVLAGQIAGFGTDVFSQEPFPVSHPYTRLAGCENVIMTPHMAWGAYEARLRCMREIAENIRSYLAGGLRARLDV